MAKLHELLAAVGPLTDQTSKVVTDLTATFDKKRHLFGKKLVTFTPSGEGAQPVTEEQLDMQSTIRKELDWLKGIWAKTLDAQFQVNSSNTKAVADVVLDNGDVLFKAVPATALLELEKRATEFRTFVASIPTLDPAKGFTLDTDQGAGIYKARPDNRVRTKKDIKVIVKYEATDKHPAQTEMVTVDVPTGNITTLEWSGLITPSEKADMMSRAEELTRAFKTARARANNVDASTDKVGDRLLNYVFTGK